MRQTQSESNSDDLPRRKSRRIARGIAAGLMVAAIGAVAVLNPPAHRVQTSPDLGISNLAAALPTAPTQEGTSSVEGPKPHFERSDEPAVEDSVKPYGG